MDGVFHADPHPGNVFLTEDSRIALIDLGMVGRITPAMQDQLLKLILSVSEGEGEQAAKITIALGEKLEDFAEKPLIREVSRIVTMHQDQSLREIDVGRVVVEITRASGEHGLRQPAELTLLGKTLLNLDLVARTLAPLPARLNRALERVADNEVRLRVDAIDEQELITGLQKIANRITIGLVLAALIVGAAMLMRVQTTWTIFGYPGFAMLLFMAAALGGVALVYDILAHDRRARRQR